MVDLVALKSANERRWANAKLTRGPEFIPVAKRLVAAKQRYLTTSARTGIPWPFIAVTHQRESSQDWTGSLAQGDPWNRVSVHVPAGRGPFNSWEDAAYDALVNCAPYAARNKDWSIGGLLTLLERYNGVGYVNRGLPSPYLWSGTDQYTRGKYIRDGVFDGNAVDKQLGCAGLIMAMISLDQSIDFKGGAITQTTALPPPPEVPPLDGLWLQNSLNALGAKPPLDVDGIVGPSTRTAVRTFQISKGLVSDGLVGPVTLSALNEALTAIKAPPPASPGFWANLKSFFAGKK